MGDRVGVGVILYWVLFAVPAIMATFERQREGSRLSLPWLAVTFSLLVLIGFRWRTGGDWGNYYRMVEDDLYAPKPLTFLGDPGFTLLLRVAARTSMGILLITVASGTMMAIALLRFCLHQPRPWLCMALAIPYLVIVMGMGYIRQGMAISCLLMAVTSIRNGKIQMYSLWIFLGSLFHSTALILFPVGALVSNRNLAIRFALVTLTVILLAYGIASVQADTLVENYVNAQMVSSGAGIRLFMTALPSAIFLVFRNRFELDEIEMGLWTILSIAGMLVFIAFFLSPSSTVVDRLGLYLLPVQCFVYSRVPAAFSTSEKYQKLIVMSILALYLSGFFVWLNFADNSSYWLPYRFYFFEDGICLEC